MVTPKASALADAGLKILTGRRAREDFADRRRSIVPTLLDHFRIAARLAFPPFNGTVLRLYDAFRLVPQR